MSIANSDSLKLNKSYQALSNNNATWHWQKWQGLPYLTCSLLQNWAHGFFTSHFSSSTPTELVEILNPSAEVYHVKQVHGNTVLTAGKSILKTEVNYPEADGLLTEKAKQAVWVCTADCVPVLMADQKPDKLLPFMPGGVVLLLKLFPWHWQVLRPTEVNYLIC